MKSNYIWMDGEFIPYHRAGVDILALSGSEGSTLFQDIRCINTEFGPAVFRLEDHIAEFLEAVLDYGVHFGYSVEFLCDTVHRTMAFNGVREGNVRPALYFNGRRIRYRQHIETAELPTLAIAAWNWEPSEKADREAAAQETGRSGPSSVPKRAALFMVQNGQIFTPPSEQFGNRVVRDSVMTLAGDHGFRVMEQPLTHAQVYDADEVFLSTQIAEIQPLKVLDERPINQGRVGPITRTLQGAFFETIQGRGERSVEWLDWAYASYVGL